MDKERYKISVLDLRIVNAYHKNMIIKKTVNRRLND